MPISLDKKMVSLDADNVSAFAFYSGSVGVTNSKRKRMRQKKRLEKLNGIKRQVPNDKSKGGAIKSRPNLSRSFKNTKNGIEIKIINNEPIVVDESDDASTVQQVFSHVDGKLGSDFNNTSHESVKETDPSSVKVSRKINENKKSKLSADMNNKLIKVGKSIKSTKSSRKLKNLKVKQSQIVSNEESPPIETLEDEVIVSSEDDTESSPEHNNTEVKRKKPYLDRVAAYRAQTADKRKSLKEEVKKQMKGKSKTSSTNVGKTLFESLISPYKVEEFISGYWEKKPLYIDRGGDSPIYSQYLSTAEMDTMLRYNMLMFGRNIDVTSYTNGVRETHNPEGRAHPHVVWDYYSNGCSVRVLNPQTYLKKIHTLLATLQEYFGCFVGSNIYLTPANTQGFAPHYDDIEAFVLQVEGSKHWRVYKPRCESEELPRFSSGNFDQTEIGSPVLDVVLRPGDLLYFPRGYIHQAEALPDQHSLHITLSTYQKTTWFDLIEKALPAALLKACQENVEFRRGLPIGYMRAAGLAYPSSSLRNEMISKLRKLLSQLEKHFDIDDAVDKLGVNFVHQSLPAVLSKDEAECSVHNGGLKMNRGTISNRVDLKLNTKIRWIRANAFRIVQDKEDVGLVHLYYSLDNSKEYEADDPQFVVLDKELLPALLHLVSSYPAYTSVIRLPCPTDDEKLVFAGDLWDRGLIVSKSPLEPCEETS